MEARITSRGKMELRRAGKWKTQLCPFDPANGHKDAAVNMNCGDHCPMFQEAVDESYTHDAVTGKRSEVTELPRIYLGCGSGGVMYDLVEDARKPTESAQ